MLSDGIIILFKMAVMKNIKVLFVLLLIGSFTMVAPAVSANTSDSSGDGQNHVSTDPAARNCTEGLEPSKCKLVARIVQFIDVLSAAVGIVVVAMIVWGGIQYTSSRDNPQQAAAAKEHIRNAIFALIFYIFSIAILNWLVPGGVL